ncbi:MAG: 50S ribosomal protein L29 [Patescibacteria group bacterium]
MAKRRSDIKAWRDLTIREISVKIEQLGQELLQSRQELLLGKLKNFRRLRFLKLERARLSTILDEKVTAKLE